MTAETHTYPFSALVGQDRLRLALLLCAVHPEIGGVLIRGEKGTAKSTAVRGLATVLIAQALSTTRADGLRIVAVCPMVAHYVGSHHDLDDIVDQVTPEILQWLSPGV